MKRADRVVSFAALGNDACEWRNQDSGQPRRRALAALGAVSGAGGTYRVRFPVG